MVVPVSLRLLETEQLFFTCPVWGCERTPGGLVISALVIRAIIPSLNKENTMAFLAGLFIVLGTPQLP